MISEGWRDHRGELCPVLHWVQRRVNSYVKEGVKGLLDKPIAAKFVSIPMTFTKKELALKRSYDA